MFEVTADGNNSDFMSYQTTTWQTFRSSEPEQNAPEPVTPTITTNNSLVTALHSIAALFRPIRTFAAEHEDWLLIAVLLLLISDCDDDWELLIAAVVFVLPKLGLFH